MQTVQLGQRQEGRKASGQLFISSDTTGDDEQEDTNIRVGLLQQHHRTLFSHYITKIRQMARTIKRQAVIKEILTNQIKSLTQESQHQQTHLNTLTARLQQILHQDRPRWHHNRASSDYPFLQSTQHSQRKGRNGRRLLFSSEKLKPRQRKSFRSEARQEKEQMVFKSPFGVRRVGLLKSVSIKLT